MRLWAVTLAVLVGGMASAAEPPLRVGAGDAEFQADDSMVSGGGILGGKPRGQEGKLRAVAVVVEKPGAPPVAIVACDVLMMNRDLLDPVAERIAKECGIPTSHVLINC